MALVTQCLYLFFLTASGIDLKIEYHTAIIQTGSHFQTPCGNEFNVFKRKYDCQKQQTQTLSDISIPHKRTHGKCERFSSSNSSSSGLGEGASGRYEDRVRSLLGHGAYELATMNKLIAHLLKNL